MLCFWQASASSAIGSRPNGVASAMLKGSASLLYIAKPSWCLLVSTMYSIPTDLASFTQSSAQKPIGFIACVRREYSSFGISNRDCIHSPM